jgi:hypothetical protein
LQAAPLISGCSLTVTATPSRRSPAPIHQIDQIGYLTSFERQIDPLLIDHQADTRVLCLDHDRMDLHLDLFSYRPAFSVTSMVGLLFHLHHVAGLRTSAGPSLLTSSR